MAKIRAAFWLKISFFVQRFLQRTVAAHTLCLTEDEKNMEGRTDVRREVTVGRLKY